MNNSVTKRKILASSSKVKNHNGGKKISQDDLRHERLKKLEIKLSQMVGRLKKKRLVKFEINPQDGSGRVLADFSINHIPKNKRILLILLTHRSLNVLSKFLVFKNPMDALDEKKSCAVKSFDEFLKDLNNIENKLKILLK